MRFVLFTEKTPSQCMKALQERLQAKATKSRPALDGWVNKSGKFSISMSSTVWGRFTRKTRLRAEASRESGITVIRGFVPNGASRETLFIIGGAVGALAVLMFARGNLVYAILAVIAGGALIVPLRGDYRNHDVLLYELEKTLKAKPTPPKPTGKKAAASK